jgi:hypothetical protein
MANIQYIHSLDSISDSESTGYPYGSEPNSDSSGNSLKYFSNILGGLLSLALTAGVVVWGYKLVVRDVSGIPVVRAAQGEMRVRPDNPGGQLAQNTGLAVNEVAALGQASGPVQRLVLAPAPIELSAEDVPMTGDMVAPVQQPASFDEAAIREDKRTAITAAEALESGSVQELLNQLTAHSGGADIKPAPDSDLTSQGAATQKPKVSGPGPKRSLRPVVRPATAPGVVVPAEILSSATTEIDPATIPAGTRLAQLGAFGSAEVARDQWEKMQGRFGEYLRGKDRIVQKAQSGGSTFYRLRAHGFTDLSDARRFCSALKAEGTDCIPVVTR